MDFNNKDISRFDEVFRESMDGFQPDLPGDLWSGIDQAVSAKTAAGAATGAKTIITIIKVAAVLIPASLGIWWLAADQKASAPQKQEVVSTSQTPDQNQVNTGSDPGNNNQVIPIDDVSLDNTVSQNPDQVIDSEHKNKEVSSANNNHQHLQSSVTQQPGSVKVSPAPTQTNATPLASDAGKPKLPPSNSSTRKVDFEAGSKVVCLGETVEFKNLSTSQFDRFRWDFDGEQLTASQSNVTYTFNRPGLYTITLTGFAGNEKMSKMMQLRVQRTQAYFTTEKNAAGNTITFNNQSVNATAYTWDFGDHSALAHEPNPKHVFLAEKEKFTVTLIAVNGACADTFKMEVHPVNEIAGGMFVPNVITPDGDGKNDRWMVKPEKPLATYHLLIMNRAGQMIYESNDMQEGWDGRTRLGKTCPSGDYFFILEYTIEGQKQEHKTGLIKLIE